MTQSKVVPSLTVCLQEQVSYQPTKPRISITILPSISFPPLPTKSKLSNFGIRTVQVTSIPPKPIFQPAIIRASISMFEKKPDDLDAEEIEKFKMYKNWKAQNGDP